MGDVKDILGIQPGDKASSGPKKDKRELKERPKGLSREAYNLLYGTHPIAPSHLLDQIAKKPTDTPKPAQPSLQTTYQFITFINEGRTDDLKLYHWVRCYKDAAGQTRPADDGPYPFAKYNKSVGAYKYDDVEYETVIRPKFPESVTGWKRADLDHLLDLCERFDLRWAVITDRWNTAPNAQKRSMEDLKDIYYAIAQALIIARAGEKTLAATNPIVRNPFNAQRERERKEYLALTLSRTAAQESEENQILAEAAAILQQRKQLEGAQRPAPTRGLLHPSTFGNDHSELPFFDATVTAVAPAKPGVYSRRAHMEDVIKRMVQQTANATKTQKALDKAIADVARLPGPPAMLTRAIMGSCLALHAEALELVEAKSKAGKVPPKVILGHDKKGKGKGPRPDEGTAAVKRAKHFR